MTLANKLTLSRIICIPVFVLFMSLNGFYARLISMLLFILADLTDLYDGYLARRLGQVTSVGQFLDPLADKLMVSAALLSFIRFSELAIPIWMIIVIISREFIINDLRSLTKLNNIVINVTKAGKLKTAVQMGAISIIMGLLMLENYGSANIAGFDMIMKGIVFWLMLIVMIITVATGMDYVARGAKMMIKKGIPQ